MAAIVPLIAAAIQLGGAVYQGIKAREQRKKADKINPVRPQYKVPEAMKKQVDLYKNLSNQSHLPQQALLEDKLNQTTSSGIDGLKAAGGSAQDIIAGATTLSGNQAQGLTDLAIQGGYMQRQAKQLYGNSLGALAGYQDQRFQLNNLYPYYDSMARKQALEGAGNANTYNSINNTGSILGEYANQQHQRKNQRLRLQLLSNNKTGK